MKLSSGWVRACLATARGGERRGLGIHRSCCCHLLGYLGRRSMKTPSQVFTTLTCASFAHPSAFSFSGV